MTLTALHLTEQPLITLKHEMKKIIKEGASLERFELPREEAIKFMEDRGEPYKVELINDLPEDAVISFYRQGDFVVFVRDHTYEHQSN